MDIKRTKFEEIKKNCIGTLLTIPASKNVTFLGSKSCNYYYYCIITLIQNIGFKVKGYSHTSLESIRYQKSVLDIYFHVLLQ